MPDAESGPSAQERHVTVMFCDLVGFTTLCENLSIAENIFLGSYRWLRPAVLEADAKRRLHDLGLDYDPASTVSRLSVAQKQLVQIVRALAFEPKVLALDEPTASLSE